MRVLLAESLLSLILVAFVVVVNASETHKHHRPWLIRKRILGVKSPGVPLRTKQLISRTKKIPFGRKSSYPLANPYNYASSSRSLGRSYPYVTHYEAYAPSFSPAPSSFYQSSYPAPPPHTSQYSDSSVSSYQSRVPYSTSYSYSASPSYSSPASYPAPLSYFTASSYPSQAAYPSYSSSSSYSPQTQQLSNSPSSSINPYSYDQSQPISYPSQFYSNQATFPGNSGGYSVPANPPQTSKDAAKKPKPKPSPPDRTERFEIRGRFFKSIGCWEDSPKDRAMHTLEGKHSQLKQHDYKTRVNALMKCAEAADEQDLKLFALQNGGQCFGGKNDENTYRKYGASTECAGDGEGGPWSNEVYSFLDDDGKLLVKPPKTVVMDSKNGSSNGSKPGCQNPCANSSQPQTTPTVCPNPCGNSLPSPAAGNTSCGTSQPKISVGAQSCGGGCPAPTTGCNANNSAANQTARGASSTGNQTQPSGSLCGGAGAGTPCPPLTTSGGCTSMGGVTPCLPQEMESSSPDCGGGSVGAGTSCAPQSITVNTGCIGSQPMGVSPCPPPDQSMAPGGCPGMPAEVMQGTSCVIQGKLVEGCPNITTGGAPCPSTGNVTGGCVKPPFPCGNGTRGPNGTTTVPNPKPGSNTTKPRPKCKAKVDIGFIIDGSGSIENSGKGNFKKVLSFVKELIRAFEVSKEATHVGIITYDNEAKLISGFDQHYTQSEIISAVEGIKYPGGGTETGKALLKAKTELFDQSARAGVPNVAVVITDGRSYDNIGAPSQQLRDAGCTVFSVGVGNGYDQEQLKEMATDPDSQHVIKAQFDTLDSIIDTIVGTACKGAGGVIQPPPTQSVLPTLPPVTAPKTKCSGKVDLAVLLDGSERIDFQQQGNFKKCQEFLKSLVGSFNIEKDGTHIGLVLFSKTSDVIFDFEKYLDVKSITEAIDKISYPNKGTNIGMGLDLVRTDLFDVSARQGVRNVLIVITGGASTDDVQEPSKKLRDMGVTIFCLGLGKEFQRDQLGDMATDPDSKHVITSGYDELNQVLPKLNKVYCQVSGGSLTTVTPTGGITASGVVGTRGHIGIGIKGSGATGGGSIVGGEGPGSGSSSQVTLVKGGDGSSSTSGKSSSSFITIKSRGGRTSSAGSAAIGSGAIIGGGGGSGSSKITIKEESDSSSTSRGISATSGGSLSSIQGRSERSSTSRAQRVMRMKKIIFGGKLGKGYSRQEDGETITAARDSGQLVKENLFSDGLLGVGVCRDKVDLAFLIDASGNKDSKGQQNFKTSLGFVKAICSMFVINQMESHIGFVVFSTNSQVVLNFKTYFDHKRVENAIDDIKYTGGVTDIGSGLELVKSKIFDSTSRPDVPRILIVVTSGKSTGDVLGPSKALRDAGVIVFCVGVGNEFDLKELDEIATDPDGSHVFTADVSQMGLVVKAIKGRVCKANVRPVALFPLNARYKARDVIGGNPPGETNHVIPAVGPDDFEGGSLSFLGTPESYIEFPNDGKLDTKDSLTILAWIFPEKEGPIFNFKRDGWGANLWLAQSRKLLAHFVERGHHELSQPLQSTKIVPNRWNFVGATYDNTSGRAGLWVNGKFEDSKNLGHIELATNYTIRMGAREGDKRNFRGRISCLQVYNVPLTSEQINDAKDNCKPYEEAR